MLQKPSLSISNLEKGKCYISSSIALSPLHQKAQENMNKHMSLIDVLSAIFHPQKIRVEKKTVKNPLVTKIFKSRNSHQTGPDS